MKYSANRKMTIRIQYLFRSRDFSASMTEGPFASPDFSVSAVLSTTRSLVQKKVIRFSTTKATIRTSMAMVQPNWEVSLPPNAVTSFMTTVLTVMVPKVASSIRKLPSRPRSY